MGTVVPAHITPPPLIVGPVLSRALIPQRLMWTLLIIPLHLVLYSPPRLLDRLEYERNRNCVKNHRLR